MRNRRRMVAGGLALAVLTAAIAAQSGHAQTASARTVVEGAAKALGGIERIRAVRNITLHGYGQYAYQMGGGRISGIAGRAREVHGGRTISTRVYDLENDRFQMRERRNMLFPFLAPFGHSFALNDNSLDGDIAFDVNGERSAARPAVPGQSARCMDGVHMRRMWMMNNPVVLVRAMLDPADETVRARGSGRRDGDRRDAQARRQADCGVRGRPHAGMGALVAPADEPGPGEPDDNVQRMVRDRRPADAARRTRHGSTGGTSTSSRCTSTPTKSTRTIADLAAPAAVRVSAGAAVVSPCSR